MKLKLSLSLNKVTRYLNHQYVDRLVEVVDWVNCPLRLLVKVKKRKKKKKKKNRLALTCFQFCQIKTLMQEDLDP
jgi:hypothetical protein